MVSRHVIEVEVSCLPKDLPEYIAVDMGDMNIGDTIHLSELVVPEGVQLTVLAHAEEGTMDPAVVSIQIARIIEEIEEVTEEAEEGVEGVEGEEAAAAGEEAAPAPSEGETD
jgi:large subunit ribosomal protein L25